MAAFFSPPTSLPLHFPAYHQKAFVAFRFILGTNYIFPGSLFVVFVPFYHVFRVPMFFIRKFVIFIRGRSFSNPSPKSRFRGFCIPNDLIRERRGRWWHAGSSQRLIKERSCSVFTDNVFMLLQL